MTVRMAFLLVLALASTGLQIQPESLTLDGVIGKDFDQVFTIINDQPQPLSGIILLDEHSEYLKDHVTISENRLLLKPQQSMNVQVRGKIPALGPETHFLKYKILDDEGNEVSAFTIEIPIDGDPKLHPKISLYTTDVIVEETVAGEATLYNFGNVIAYYDLMLRIKENGEEIGTVNYPQQTQVLPGGQKEIVVIYTGILDPGEYAIELAGTVNGEQEISATQPFRVLLSDQRKKINIGEDLVLELKRYSNTPKIEYVLTSGAQELIRETTFSDEDLLIVPTSTLEPGTYDLVVKISHGSGTDTNRISVVVAKRNFVALPLVALLLVIGIIGALFKPRLSLKLKIVLLTWKVKKRERVLNALIRRSHKLHNAYDARRTY